MESTKVRPGKLDVGTVVYSRGPIPWPNGKERRGTVTNRTKAPAPVEGSYDEFWITWEGMEAYGGQGPYFPQDVLVEAGSNER